MGGLIEAVSGLLPHQDLSKILLILRAATDGAQTAEDLWLLDQLPKDQRNARAKEIARETIEKAGFEVTPQIETIISGVIEVVCILLPHGVEPMYNP